MLGSIAGPILLSFDRRVHYVQHWKSAFKSGIVVAIPFIIWDYLFTYHSFWGFSSDRIIGFYLGNLPIEEVSFFLIVPFCCIFIYELLTYFNYTLPFPKFWKWFSFIAGISLLCIGIAYFNRWYTFLSCSIGGASLIVLYLFSGINWARFWLTYAIHLIPFLVINGFLTYFPVVWYNNQENLGIRWLTIPVEDSSYSLIALIWNILLYDYFKRKKGLGKEN
jgi:lycopene cyclase domain-containing protein